MGHILVQIVQLTITVIATLAILMYFRTAMKGQQDILKAQLAAQSGFVRYLARPITPRSTDSVDQFLGQELFSATDPPQPQQHQQQQQQQQLRREEEEEEEEAGDEMRRQAAHKLNPSHSH